jgi:hypothetical protein
LDSAIKRLNELRLESAGAILSATVCESEKDISSAHNLLAEGMYVRFLQGIVVCQIKYSIY